MDGWKTTFLVGRPIFRGYVSFREGKHLINSYRACQSSPGFLFSAALRCITFFSSPSHSGLVQKYPKKIWKILEKKHHLSVVVLRMHFECCRVVCPKTTTSDTQRRHVLHGSPGRRGGVRWSSSWGVATCQGWRRWRDFHHSTCSMGWEYLPSHFPLFMWLFFTYLYIEHLCIHWMCWKWLELEFRVESCHD